MYMMYIYHVHAPDFVLSPQWRTQSETSLWCYAKSPQKFLISPDSPFLTCLPLSDETCNSLCLCLFAVSLSFSHQISQDLTIANWNSDEVPTFLAHLALPKWAYIIMIHEMDPNMGSWFRLCGVCVICVRVLIAWTLYFADISHNTPN